ncbi:MAG: tetratricopeptide repeat protein [Gammaproteobacteria bacterium]|nr:tetratricopeptide repeat protein [Gammaproteobacteria bacterium]MDH5302553.1 tetratricopeptide repeat protein [Gammaproteobacteria bacterium]MDH5321032.1 tetratricopeptide repeat protein [Gammaproteobacteria bacterium]
MKPRTLTLMLVLAAPLMLATLASAEVKKSDTIESLEKKDVEIRSGKVIVNSTDLARDSYRAFLELVSEDPELRAEAMRRLGDLELDAMEADQLVKNIDAINDVGYNNAVDLYQQLLEAYPDYRRNDTVLYQLGRAYEIGGRNDDALQVLNELIARYPQTPLIDEVQFRRGEMLFMRKDYGAAEMAYKNVVAYGAESKFYEQSLYKLGWSQFKLAWHEESLDPFFELLDRKIGDIELQEGDQQLEHLSRANQELVMDTFRVLSISFSYMEGPASIDEYFGRRGAPDYSYVIYRNLGNLYLEKERYVDAAEAYEAFVDLDPYHPKAPLLQVEVIEAYKRGGFPTLVLEGKKGFVERYGMDGAFWTRNLREENTAVAGHLKANLIDLAQYSHAEAQKNGRITDYQEAARWYRKYLAYFPGEADSANTNFLLAEILFESKAFADATDEYERTAYTYPAHEHSAEAGYAAILAYREHEATLLAPQQSEARAAWHSRYLDSGLKFADTFPLHPESGAVLTTVAEDLFAQRQFDLAIAVGQAVIGKQPPVAAPLARTAWTVVAHSQFDLGNYAEAEQSYYRLQAYTPADDLVARQEIKDRVASSIYKQGEFARDMGFLEEAVTHFTRLGEVVPDSGIRATAEYDAAAALINLQAWDRASSVLEQFRRNYPDSEFAGDITQKLAVSYLSSGRSVEAAAEFERIAMAAESSDDVRREALWKAAELYEQSGTISSEQRVLTDIIERYPSPLAESIEARYRLLQIAEQNGNQRERTARLQDLVRVDASAGVERTDRSRYLAAKASLELAEPIRHRFQAVKLTQPLAESMKLKRALMEDVLEAYTKLADYGIAEVTTAATFRLGEAYEIFSSDLMASERPGDLDAAAMEQYELLLEEQMYPFEEKAIDLYKANADRAPDGIYDDWVRKSFARLASLMPARYAKVERSEDVVTALY